MKESSLLKIIAVEPVTHDVERSFVKPKVTISPLIMATKFP